MALSRDEVLLVCAEFAEQQGHFTKLDVYAYYGDLGGDRCGWPLTEGFKSGYYATLRTVEAVRYYGLSETGVMRMRELRAEGG